MAKQIIGTVSSNKGDKTIIVTVQTRKTHPLYRKQYTATSKYMAHDEENQANPGDRVVIVETRPLSARKRHKLAQVIEKATLSQESLSATKEEDIAKHPDSKAKHLDVDKEEQV